MVFGRGHDSRVINKGPRPSPDPSPSLLLSWRTLVVRSHTLFGEG